MLQWFVGQSQVIMGVDPGSRVMGYGVLRAGECAAIVREGVTFAHGATKGRARQNLEIEAGPALDWGTLCPPPKATFADKVYFLHRELQALCQNWQPAQVVIEDVFVSQNVQSAFRLAHIRGVVMLAARQVGADVVELAPARVKKVITGSGRAEKTHLALLLKQLLHLPPSFNEPLDVTDALALAFAYAELQNRDSTLITQGEKIEL